MKLIFPLRLRLFNKRKTNHAWLATFHIFLSNHQDLIIKIFATIEVRICELSFPPSLLRFQLHLQLQLQLQLQLLQTSHHIHTLPHAPRTLRKATEVFSSGLISFKHGLRCYGWPRGGGTSSDGPRSEFFNRLPKIHDFTLILCSPTGCDWSC